MSHALDELSRKVDQAIAGGANIIILSDRGIDRRQAPMPALLAVAGLHHHLIRHGTRTRVSLVLESGEPREVHHFALLIGYGVSAINPYLAFETLDDMIREGALPEVDHEHAVKNYIKAVVKGHPEGHLEDGHLLHPELPRGADFRGHRAEPGGD